MTVAGAAVAAATGARGGSANWAAALRCFHQPGSMPSAPTTMPPAKAASTTRTSGARQEAPKKKLTVASCWLFSAKAKRVKKMAALSSNRRYFMRVPVGGGILCRRPFGESRSDPSLLLGVEHRGAFVDRLAQGLARLEMRHPLLRD